MSVRAEYWDNSKELIEWCTDDELKVLGQQAVKALDKRMSHYLGKFDAKEHERHMRGQKLVKHNARRKTKAGGNNAT
jgi:hypothetical protein